MFHVISQKEWGYFNHFLYFFYFSERRNLRFKLGMASLGFALLGLAWLGMAWLSLAWHRLTWFGLA